MRVYRWIFVVGLVVGVGALFAVFSNNQQNTIPKPERLNQAAPQTTTQEDSPGQTEALGGGLNPPELDLDPRSNAVIVVDSFPLDEQGAITAWRGLEGSAGHFDQLLMLDGSRPADAGVASIDILSATRLSPYSLQRRFMRSLSFRGCGSRVGCDNDLHFEWNF